ALYSSGRGGQKSEGSRQTRSWTRKRIWRVADSLSSSHCCPGVAKGFLATRYLMEREKGRIIVRSAQSPRPFSERSSVDGAEARHKAQVDAGQQQIAEVMNMIVVLTQKSVKAERRSF
ncbi:hypothetical protein BGZ88_005092, partial [Linnemannia elongata]